MKGSRTISDHAAPSGGPACYGGASALLDLAPTLNAHGNRLDFETEAFVCSPVMAGALPGRPGSDGADDDDTAYIAHALRGEGFDASEDGTGRGTPLLGVMHLPVSLPAGDQAFSIQLAHTTGNGWGIQENVTHTLDRTASLAVAVALRGRNGGASAELGGGVANALRSSKGGGDKSYVLAPLSRKLEKTTDAAGRMAVRKLTPRECERLQGIWDDYTLIPWKGKPAEQCPDGPRYKVIGNGMAVPCVRWILLRMMPQPARSINVASSRRKVG